MNMTLEERIKRIEDELGLTVKYEEKIHRGDLFAIAVKYGLSNHLAKELAYEYSELSEVHFKNLLLKRGCVCQA